MKRILIIALSLLLTMSTMALADVGVRVDGMVLVKVLNLKFPMEGVKVQLIDKKGNILKEMNTIPGGIFQDLSYYFPYPDTKKNTYQFKFKVKASLDSSSKTKYFSCTFKKSKPDQVKSYIVRMTINYGKNPPPNIPFGGFYWN
ncbi:MAG: hypothetical protein PHX53_00930 [Syntrophales bacterium]|nr:hypothetical protein [Syntrophales bacterium]